MKPAQIAGGAAGPTAAGTLKERADRFEADTLLAALRETDWNVADAARKLDLPLRTMQHKMKMHGIKRGGFSLGDPDLERLKATQSE
jgi:transcriptional regulator with GAF, ATPase, and Fis domain